MAHTIDRRRAEVVVAASSLRWRSLHVADFELGLLLVNGAALSSTASQRPRGTRLVAAARMLVGVCVIAILGWTYAGRVAAGDSNPFDFFGYFTNQTSLLTSALLIFAGWLALRERTAPAWLAPARGVAVTCVIIVGVIYNTLVPGTGSAPPWVSAILHLIFPCLVVADWLLIGDRPPLAWRRLWLVLPYPITWMLVVLVRGATDGWVPYGFLLPEHGLARLLLHVLGLLIALTAAGALVWWATRFPGLTARRAPTRPLSRS